MTEPLPQRDELVVVEPGLFSTFQDFGRYGYQRFGISPSGAMDRVAMIMANALVGNDADTAVIEVTLSGPVLRVEAAICRFACCGMQLDITVNGAAVPNWAAFEARRGDEIRFQAPRAGQGMRAYIAVAGGFDLPPVLGSLSTHSRSGIGGLDGRALLAGDCLPLAASGLPASGKLLELEPRHRPDPAGPIRVLLGPQEDSFTDEGIRTFLSSDYVVSNRCDRMGYQLDGPVIEHAAGFNIVSDGIMNGSIQVPGSGRPIVLLADRQTTGGYPKIATVIEPDLWRLAQRRPGDIIRFEAVDADEAELEALRFRETLDRMLRSLTPRRPDILVPTTESLLENNLISGVVEAGFPEAGVTAGT